MTARADGWLRALAAPRWTLLFFLLAAAGALAVAQAGWPATWAVAPALALLVVNLTAAVAVNRRFRADLPLLLFHLALVVLVGLLVLARLSHFDGRAVVENGAVFDGWLADGRPAGWHGQRLAGLRFRNEGFVDHYAAAGPYALTVGRVRWWDAGGQARLADIRDGVPLVLDGYRIYLAGRGYAPRFLWQPAQGDAEWGGAQMPARTPQQGIRKGVRWRSASGVELWLSVEERPPTTAGPREVADLGVRELDHRLVVGYGDDFHELRPGESVALPAGRFTYRRLGVWMGYRIVYDAVTPWLFATLTVAIGSLVWFYWPRLFAARAEEQA